MREVVADHARDWLTFALAPDGADLSGLDAWRRYPETPWAVWAGLD